MKKGFLFPFASVVYLLAVAVVAHGQANTSQMSSPQSSAAGTRPRTVTQQTPPSTQQQTGQSVQQRQQGTTTTTTPTPAATPSVEPRAPDVTATLPAPTAAPNTVPSNSSPTTTTVPSIVSPYASVPVVVAAPLLPARPIAPARARTRIAEAQRLLKTRLSPTASAPPSLYLVTVAALEQESSQIHLLTIPKQTFLMRGAETVLTTSQGMNVRLRVVRSNYVNTAVIVSDLAGRQLTPLVVEYPIEKGGRFKEMAYYTSAHPALITPELVKAGQHYVRSMLDLAAKRLQDKGKFISPQIVDIAERLCVVEHSDHERFRNESRLALYEEVYALFALNELDTYRYSVSSAGAGGMVQMIPSTYQMLRRMHPSVGLNPDFVAGMRNHGNALEAMLLHMQDNWNALVYNPDVTYAMSNKWATQPELVAAGYNSNSARLPLYIRRGGASWRTLIPRETQMYLQIYKSLEGLVQFKPRAEKQ
ncbi:MAG TPA: hypothetical protein VF666_16675 [Pyrinomonadaceae bacterium]|jgi:hypothetical protein